MRDITEAHYQSLFDSMTILPARERECHTAAMRVLDARQRYVTVDLASGAP